MAEVVPNAVRARAGAIVGPVRAPLILFDGVCNLCNAWVRFVIRRDPTGIFRFAAQQSPVGQALIEDHVRGAGQLSSIVLMADGGDYTESDASLRIFARLGPPCFFSASLRIIRRRGRDSCRPLQVRYCD